ncbi:MAG: hypothetical protein WCK73_13630, partial [Deltaproteobacteria bacterium]
MRALHAVAVVTLAFAVGAASTEGVVRMRAARAEKVAATDGSIGELVAFEVRTEDGATLAKSRLVSPEGKVASVT